METRRNSLRFLRSMLTPMFPGAQRCCRPRSRRSAPGVAATLRDLAKLGFRASLPLLAALASRRCVVNRRSDPHLSSACVLELSRRSLDGK